MKKAVKAEEEGRNDGIFEGEEEKDCYVKREEENNRGFEGRKRKRRMGDMDRETGITRALSGEREEERVICKGRTE